MLSLLMKREITEEKKKEIEECLIKLERNSVEFDDGIKFEIEKKPQQLKNGTMMLFVNITEYVGETCVGSIVYDYMYYMNVITNLIRNAFDLKVKCSCGNENCECEVPKKDLGEVYLKHKSNKK